MPVRVEIRYLGDLRCEAIHEPSGHRIVTDAPLDNEGKGEAFSPTDLAGTSSGTCMVTLMGIAARRLGVDIEGTRCSVEKEMIADPERRIARLSIEIHVPKPVEPRHRIVLERAARTCPVSKSFDPKVQLEVSFQWV